MLHITNGDAAAGLIQTAGLQGAILPWRDVLHEGPVPEVRPARLRQIRARFIADCGWDDYDGALADLEARDRTIEQASSHDEIVLWFEHDLYDQLQLVQVLDGLAEARAVTSVSWILTTTPLGTIPPALIAEIFEEREPVPREAIPAAREAWAAFRQDTPAGLNDLLRANGHAIPHLCAALRRHMQEFPWMDTGLSRSERQLLEALARGPRTIRDACHAAHHEREDATFLGDSVFATYVARLSRGEHAAIRGAEGEIRPSAADDDDYWSSRISLTTDGRRLLAGESDWVRMAGVGRWLGGVHLVGRDTPWRWDETAERVSRLGDHGGEN